jgi:hypothetical protein
MKTSSAKNKGRLLQQYVRDKILGRLPLLTKDDCISKSMGAGGEDIVLSKEARKIFPFSIECKSLASISIYKYYEQACKNSGDNIPLLVIKANRKHPLVVIDLEDFLDLVTKN